MPPSSFKDNEVHRFLVAPRAAEDPRSAGFLQDAHALGISAVEHIRCLDLYFIQGTPTPLEIQTLADRLLHDPVTQEVLHTHPAAGNPSAADCILNGIFID